MRCAAVLAFGAMLILVETVSAKTLYVNNLTGRISNDGLSPEDQAQFTGPTNSIRQALKLATNGDTIVLANTGTPYYESFTLVGARLGGISAMPLTIEGNGATLSGLRELPAGGWCNRGQGLWEISFNRKGFYHLVRNGTTFPEFRPAASGQSLEDLPLGHWVSHRGHVFLRTSETDEPRFDRFDYAAEDVGITLYHVNHVRIANLTVEHFRVDGINAFNDCHGIELDNVTCRENGRAGLAACGASSVIFRRGTLESNGRDAALVTGKAALSIENSTLDAEPTVQR
ncbi:MAG: right-handed parallel beta-helix repeat-containing protein [Planctomycetaceae bacterium]